MNDQNQTNVEPTPPDPAVPDAASQRDAMASIFDELSKQGDAVSTESEQAAEAPEDAPEPEQVTEGGEEEFAASLESEEGAEDADAKVRSTPSGPATSAPTDFPKAIKEKWDSIDPEVQKALIARDHQQRRKFSEQGVELQKIAPIADKLGTLTEQFPQFKGATPAQVADRVAQLAAVQAHLDANPLKGVLDIAQTYGVLGHLQQALSGQRPSDDKTAVLQLQKQVSDLTRQLNGQRNSQNSADIDSLVDTRLNLRAVEEVMNDFAVQHELTAEEFNELEPFVTLARKLEPDADAEKVLQKAYNMAVNENALLRTSARTGAENATTGAAVATAANGGPSTARGPNTKRTVNAAKAAALNVKSIGQGKSAPKSQRQAMGEAFDRMTS